jgi:hypothetical membrane protein
VRKLLWAGVIGPLLFILVFLLEGFTRPGYSQWRNFVSQLSTGDGGWMQVVNFFVCGALVLAFAFGLRHALEGTRGSIGIPVLFGLFALGLFIAGTFTTDPDVGYPVGAPTVHTTAGIIHGLAGLAAFTILAATCFVTAWHFAGEPGSTRWAVYSAVVGAVVLIFFIASGAAAAMDNAGRWPDAPAGFFQRISIMTGWTWIAMVALRLIRAEEAKNRSRRVVGRD